MKPPPIATLLVGTVAISSAAVLIVLTRLPAEAIAVWRLGVTALVFAPFAARRARAELAALDGRARLALLAGGVAFGLHFVWFPMGFTRTSYESTVLLLVSQPVMAAVLGALFLGEAISGSMLVSMALATLGLAILVWDDYHFRPEQLAGDAIVLASCVAIVTTRALARRLRQRLGFATYVCSISALGACVAWLGALTRGVPLTRAESGATEWVALALLLLVPTIGGHTVFHYVVKYVRVFHVNLVILAEPVIAIVMKHALAPHFAVFRGNALTRAHWVGGALLFAGVGIGLVLRDREEPPGEPNAARADAEGAVQ